MKVLISIIIVGTLFCAALTPLSLASDIGKRSPSERRTFVDKVTGLTITALTTSSANDQLPYQTHPHWTSDGKYIIFHSDRASDGSNQAFALCDETGEIIQLTEGATRTNGLNVARKSNRLYYLRGATNEPKELIELELDPLLADSKAGTMKSPDAYLRVIMSMPENLKDSGGFVLDADETAAYIGVSFEGPAEPQNEGQAATGAQKGNLSTKTTRRYGIRGIDLKTGELTLLEKNPGEGSTRSSLQKIVTQANRCRKIVRGLLDFSRQSKPDERPCNVNTVLQECVSLVANQALFRNIEIVRQLGEELPLVPMDPSQMQQVFMNLIINAAEAMDGEGRLALTTCHDPIARTVEVGFVDSGHGIRSEDVDRVFEPFFTTKEVGHGTGLGLAISFGIVKEHHGAISVESEIGKGTAFTVSLPVDGTGEG